MATVNLTSKQIIDSTNDSVVIVNHLESVPGGRTLDVTGFPDSEISAGHVIMKETSTGEYKPLPVNGTKPAGHEYAGYLVSSLSVDNAQASIMYAGTINEAFCKYAIPADAKTTINRVTIINE